MTRGGEAARSAEERRRHTRANIALLTGEDPGERPPIGQIVGALTDELDRLARTTRGGALNERGWQRLVAAQALAHAVRAYLHEQADRESRPGG
jgi:hypothetical protein